jgi:hypothetical protein
MRAFCKKLDIESINLRVGNDGYPVLPDWPEIENEQLPYKKLLIGRFMRDTYRKCFFL